MSPVCPRKLSPGDHVRVVAPARSLSIISADIRARACDRLASLGLAISFGDHVEEIDEFVSTSAAHRAADLMAAFADPTVDGILTVIGGYNSNELLPLLDFDVIRSNPKVLCGYSDITALQLAILGRAGVVTYSGPHFSTFGMEHHFDQTFDWFQQCVIHADPFEIRPAATWSDDAWFLDQDARTIEPNPGWACLRAGHAAGRLIGGNLATLGLLRGTEWWPALGGSILWLEDDLESPPWTFRRNLVALTQLPDFRNVSGLVIGRMQRLSGVTASHLERIVDECIDLDIPVLAGVDVGHTDPMLTLPVGGAARLDVAGDDARFVITEH